MNQMLKIFIITYTNAFNIISISIQLINVWLPLHCLLSYCHCRISFFCVYWVDYLNILFILMKKLLFNLIYVVFVCHSICKCIRYIEPINSWLLHKNTIIIAGSGFCVYGVDYLNTFFILINKILYSTIYVVFNVTFPNNIHTHTTHQTSNIYINIYKIMKTNCCRIIIHVLIVLITIRNYTYSYL